jgi:hypothetical protein
MAIVGEARLAVNVDKLTESAIIMLKDYYYGFTRCRLAGQCTIDEVQTCVFSFEVLHPAAVGK